MEDSCDGPSACAPPPSSSLSSSSKIPLEAPPTTSPVPTEALLPVSLSQRLGFLQTLAYFVSMLLSSPLLSSPLLASASSHSSPRVEAADSEEQEADGSTGTLPSSSSSSLFSTSWNQVITEMAALLHWLTVHVVPLAVKEFTAIMLLSEQKHTEEGKEDKSRYVCGLLGSSSFSSSTACSTDTSDATDVEKDTACTLYPPIVKGDYPSPALLDDDKWNIHDNRYADRAVAQWDGNEEVVQGVSGEYRRYHPAPSHAVRAAMVLVETVESILLLTTNVPSTRPPSPLVKFSLFQSRRVHHSCYSTMVAVLGIAEQLPSPTVASMTRIMAQSAEWYWMEEELSWLQQQLMDEGMFRNGKEETVKARDVVPLGDVKEKTDDDAPLLSLRRGTCVMDDRALSPFLPPLWWYVSPPWCEGRTAAPQCSPALQEEERILQVCKGSTVSLPSLVTTTTTLSHVQALSRVLQQRMEEALIAYTNSTPHPVTREDEEWEKSGNAGGTLAADHRHHTREYWRDTPEKERNALHVQQLKQAKQALLSLADLKRLQANEEVKKKRQRDRTTTTPKRHKEGVWVKKEVPYFPTLPNLIQDGEEEPPHTSSSFFSIPSSGSSRRRKTLRDYEKEIEKKGERNRIYHVIELNKEKQVEDHTVEEKMQRTFDKRTIPRAAERNQRMPVEVFHSKGGDEREDDASDRFPLLQRGREGHQEKGREMEGTSSCRNHQGRNGSHTLPPPRPPHQETGAVSHDPEREDPNAAIETASFDITVNISDLAQVTEAFASLRYRCELFWDTVARYTRWQLYMAHTTPPPRSLSSSTPMDDRTSVSSCSHLPPCAAPLHCTHPTITTSLPSSCAVSSTVHNERLGKDLSSPTEEETLDQGTRDLLRTEVLRICFALAFAGQKSGYRDVMEAIVHRGLLPKALPNPIKN